MDIQENEIEQDLISKENSFFNNETFISNINEILKGTDSIAINDSFQAIFNEIRLNYVNPNIVNSFTNFLNKIEKENLIIFLEKILKINFYSKSLINVVCEGLLGFLHPKFQNVQLLEICVKILVEKISLKSFKRIERLIKIVRRALNNKETTEQTVKLLSNLNDVYAKNFNFIVFIGNLLKFNALNGSMKSDLENSFCNFYCEYILSDDERDKNLSKQRSLNVFMKFLDKTHIHSKILLDVQTLLMRSSSNFKFLENIFIYGELQYDKTFSEELLSKYQDYFFNEKTFDSAKQSFRKAVNYADKKVLLEKLLQFNFIADKADLNLNICFYLSNILYSKDYIIEKYVSEIDPNLDLSWDDFCKITTFVLKKLEMLNENNKPIFELVLDNLVKAGLLFHNNLNLNGNFQEKNKHKLNKNIQEEFLKQIKKLLTSSTFCYFYQHIFMIISQLAKETNIEFDKAVLDAIFNHVNLSINITNSNYKNTLAAFTAGFTIVSFLDNSNALLNTYKKQISQATSALSNPEAFILLSTGIDSENGFDLVNFINIVNSFTSKFSLNKNFRELFSAELKDIMKILGIGLFFKSDKFYEKICFRNFAGEICSKEYFNSLLNNSFIFLMNNFSLNSNNQNNNFLYEKNFEKFSYVKLRILLEYFSQHFEGFDEKDFLKFIVMINLNNLDNNSRKSFIIPGKGSLYKNKLLNKLKSIDSENIAKLEIKIQNFIKVNYKTICSFIFSDIGLFNKLNPAIKNASLNIIKFTAEKNLSDTMNNFINYSFEFLNVEKLYFIDKLAEYYKKEMDFISFYDMENLVDSLKCTEKNYKSSLSVNLIPEKKVVQNVQKTQTASKGGKPKAPAQPIVQKKEKVVEVKEKVDKEIKILEYKEFIENFILRISKNFEGNLLTIFEILHVLNNSLLFNEKKRNSEQEHKYNTHKANLIFSIKKIWNIFSVKFISEGIKKAFTTLFQANNFSKNFAIEFSNLIYAEANPINLSLILDNYPNIIETFNEKLNHLLNPTQSTNELETNKLKLFEYFDFVVIRILFFSILAPEISNDQKSNSVDNLIKIIETLNKEILNFEDISTLAVSLLKTSYNSENLTILLEIFMKRCSQDNFLTLCNDILDYEYVAKLSFLEQILHLNFNYFRNYKNLVYKIWILLFDENENISNLSLKIWNKFHLYLDIDYSKSQEFKLAFSDHHLVDSMNAANRAYAFILPSQIGYLIKEYENFFEADLERSIKESKEDFDTEKIKRVILFDFIDETIDLFSEQLKKELLEFLTRISDREYNHEIFSPMNTSINNIIKSISDEKILQNIIESSESNIRNLTGKASKDINLKALKIILMILNSILMKENILKNQKIKSSTIDQLYESIYVLSTKVEDYDILLLIGISFLYLSKENQEKSKLLLNKILEEFKSESQNAFNSGKCFILASLVKYFGISTLKTQKIYDAILENMKKQKSIVEKQNSMLLIKVLSFSLKKLFEPYLVELFDKVCELITDREEKVRNFTQAAIKSFMKELSGYGVKSIMPRLIKDLHSMNWRSKVVNIEILGQFAFCAPKQLSVYIPKVIKEIMIVFRDPHYKVQETAVNVLKDISSVIKNPEIVELSSLLIDAISNPPEKSKDALTAILETDFKHAIDPPSLALIIPIIDYNLKVDNENLKKMAAHVIGSIANLIIDPIHIFHYLDIIMPNLKVALFDGIPECRNAMSKAIGSLAKSLGEEYLKEIMVWLDKFLTYQSETVQKSGAAQAYSEILVAMGDSFIDHILPNIISKIQENDYITKEGYLSIFVFLPGCMGEKFEKYFDLIFPLIIEAFSDDHENVRNVSNKIFEICIRLYAKRNTKQLLEPLLTRLFDSNWRIRNSSIALIKTLIMNLNKEFFKETSTSFPKELRDQVLNYTFILKADTYGNTATIANMIWRDYVDNIPKYLTRILKNIYETIMDLLTINNDETLDIAEGIIRMLCTKFSDKFFYELVPIMKENLIEKKDSENVVYATFYIIQLACSDATEKLLGGFKEKILKIVFENISSSHASVRKLLASVIFEIANKFRDASINKNFIHHVMKLARGKPHDEQNHLLEIVANLIEISEGEVLSIAMTEIFKKPYEQGFIALADNISETISKTYTDPVEYKELYNRFLDVLPNLPEISIKAIVSITIQLEDEFLPIFVEFLEKYKNKIISRMYGDDKISEIQAEYLTEILEIFLDKTTHQISMINSTLLEMIVSMLTYTNTKILQNIGKSLKSLVEKSEKSDLDNLLENFLRFLRKVEERLEIENIDKSLHLIKNFKIIMEYLLFFLQHSLLYAEDKMLASDYVQRILDYTTREVIKPYIMKFNGPLIRILSEKLSPAIKEKILDNIKSIIIKSKDDIKGISPQLQSVFIKTLTDTSQENCERAQLKAGENILRLLQFYPRTDVIANDIMKSIVSKCEKGEGMFSVIEIEILSDIIRFYGTALKQTVIDDHYAKIQKLLNSNLEIPYDILIILLSAYTKLQKEVSDCEKLIENTEICAELPRKLFNFVTIFNGNLNYFNLHKKNAVKLIKPLPKDQSVIMLKNLGKIINKYSYFIEFDKENIDKLIENYSAVIEQIILETDILVSTNPMIDANLCVFLLSLGYLKSYNSNQEFFKKVLDFVLKSVEAAKVNSQLLVNCLSLLTLKEIKPNADHIEITNALIEIETDEKVVERIEGFLKKVYYFKDK